MAELLDDIGTYLVAQSVGTLYVAGLSSSSVAIYLGMMREENDRNVTLIELPGLPPTETMGDSTAPIYATHRLQVLCRHVAEDYVNALALANQVYDALVLVANETINGTYYLKVSATQTPTLLEWDDEHRAVFACTYLVVRG